MRITSHRSMLSTLLPRIHAKTNLFSAVTAQRIISLLLITAVAISFGLSEAQAGFPSPPGLPGLPAPPGLPGSPNVDVRINGYLPAPPGVNVQIDAGRPYYVERDRRVYMERERPGKHYKKSHYKKEKKHKGNNGNQYGHDKHDKHR